MPCISWPGKRRADPGARCRAADHPGLRRPVGLATHIAIITGNDFYYQKQRILDPIINAGIAEDITFFSDGGSRLFEYKGNNQFEEVYSYSEDAKIDKEDVNKVNNIFEKLLQNFLSKDSNKTLMRPDIKEIERSYDKYGTLRTLKLALGPFNKESFDTQSAFLVKKIEDLGSELRLSGNPKIKSAARFIEIHFDGIDAATDSEKLRMPVLELFIDFKQHFEVSKPLLEGRGGVGFISQLALKPFKRPELRREFYEQFIVEMQKEFGGEKFDILLGGRTTIDIQRKKVNKRKSMKYLYDQGADPDKMIYFGDEFVEGGNDMFVALATDDYKPPSIIIHVGRHSDDITRRLAKEGLLTIDGNDIDGTANYLNVINKTLSWKKIDQ